MTDNAQNPTQDETTGKPSEADQLAMLKNRARLMGISFSNNIGIDALREKIRAKMEGETQAQADDANAELDSGPPVAPALGETNAKPLSKRDAMVREHMALVRCRITNLDPKKAELPGEIFTVANRMLGTVRKFIPYGEATDNGYHIPKILFNELASRKFLHIRSFKSRQTGQIQVETKWMKEFSLEVLPPLTKEELDRLATAQIAAGTVKTGELV
jgi:hypothetical protein